MIRFKSALPAVLALLLAACGQDGTPGSATTGEGADDAPLDSPVVATVNGEAVRAAVLDAYLRARGTTEATPAQRRQALQEVVNLVLLRQQAEKQGLDESTAVRADLALHRLSTLATRQVRDHNEQNPVTDADARAEYEENRETAGLQEYKVRHILVDSEQAARQAIADLNQGADFAELANERSMDTRNSAGGDLGWLNLAQLPEPLRQPVRGLQPGAHSNQPVQTRYGWHVLKLEDSREMNPPEFDQVKSGIVASLQRQRMESYLEELRAGADIKVTEDMAQPAPGNQAAVPAARPEDGGGTAEGGDDQGG